MANTKLEQSGNFLTRAFNKFLVPSMLISLGYTVNILFDGIIVGQKLGADSFTAVNICMPIYLFLCTVGSLIGNGCYLLSSRAVGENDYDKSQRIYNTSILLMFVLGVLITIFGLVFLTPICKLLCGGIVIPDVYDYAQITIMGSLIKMFLYIPLLYLRLVGKINWATTSTILMTVANIILDLVLVVFFEMGTAGAALASVLATLFALIVGTMALLSAKTFKFSFKFESIKNYFDIIKYGAPAAMNNLMSALRVLLINTALITFGTGVEITVFSILNNVNEISLFIVDGLPQTATPFLAIYSAEHSHKGIKIMMDHQFKLSLLFTAIFGLIIVSCTNYIPGLFDYNVSGLYFEFICLAFSIIIAGISRILIFYYNASGENLISSIFTALRLVIMPVGLLYLLILSERVVWLFWPIGEVLTLAILFVILKIRHQSHKNESLVLLLDSNDDADTQALEFSVKAVNNEICGASEKIGDYCSEIGLPPKVSMRISLALEEILTLMNTKCLEDNGEETFDLRVFSSDEKTGIRIRCLGHEFNPLDKNNVSNEEFDEYTGIKMITNMTNFINYSYICGVNNLLVII